MEKCYDYFACTKKDCIMFDDSNQNKCWDSEETLCNHDRVTNTLFDKLNIDKCKVCLYYKHEKSKIN